METIVFIADLKKIEDRHARAEAVIKAIRAGQIPATVETLEKIFGWVYPPERVIESPSVLSIAGGFIKIFCWRDINGTVTKEGRLAE